MLILFLQDYETIASTQEFLNNSKIFDKCISKSKTCSDIFLMKHVMRIDEQAAAWKKDYIK